MWLNQDYILSPLLNVSLTSPRKRLTFDITTQPPALIFFVLSFSIFLFALLLQGQHHFHNGFTVIGHALLWQLLVHLSSIPRVARVGVSVYGHARGSCGNTSTLSVRWCSARTVEFGVSAHGCARPRSCEAEYHVSRFGFTARKHKESRCVDDCSGLVSVALSRPLGWVELQSAFSFTGC